ncbi:MAG: sulfatase-like hydrolase/transferase [Planctomycetota bacterium]
MPDNDWLEPTAATHKPEQPNILIIMSDEHRWDYSQFNGDPVVQTPHLDRLAQSGVNFTNAYCNSPLCSPSRQSFMAGLYPYRIGLWNNTSSMPESTATWAHALSAAGYETMLCGKMHFNGFQKMYGFDRRPVLEGNNNGDVFYSWGIRTTHDWTQPLKPCRSGPKDITQAGIDVPERQPIFQHDARIVNGTIDILKEKAAQPDGKPWALCCSTVLPHPPFTARKDLYEKYRGRSSKPFNPFGEGLGACDRSLREYYNLASNAYTLEDLQVLRDAYYGLIEEFDEYVGQVLDMLETTGLAKNTIVIYVSDHGEMAGDFGMIGKVTLRESSVRIPMIVRYPGRSKPGTTCDTPVSLVDIYPTLLDIAGTTLPAPLKLDGNSLIPLIDGRTADFKGGSVFCEFEGEGWNHPRAMLRDGDFKYIHYHTDAPELYNLAIDPQETTNLAPLKEYAKTCNRLRALFPKDWDGAKIETEVIESQARMRLSRCRNVCKDIGW